jgi:hypothetical protein
MGLGARKATREGIRLRMTLDGPTKSGKTFDSLVIGSSIIRSLAAAGSLEGNGRQVLIDAENGRAKHYADVFDFDHHNLYDFSPESYIDTLKLAEQDRYSVVIIDQISHEWSGKNGTLELKNNAEVLSGGKLNSWTAWNQITPRHNRFIEALMAHPAHLLCTMRSKMEHVQEQDERGKWKIRRVGMEPIQRDTTAYEFDVEASITQEGIVTVKTRGSLSLSIGERIFRPGSSINHPGEVLELGEMIGQWLAGSSSEDNGFATHEQIKEIRELGEKLGVSTYEQWKGICSFWKITSLNAMTPETYEKIKKDMIKNIGKKESAKKQTSQV